MNGTASNVIWRTTLLLNSLMISAQIVFASCTRNTLAFLIGITKRIFLEKPPPVPKGFLAAQVEVFSVVLISLPDLTYFRLPIQLGNDNPSIFTLFKFTITSELDIFTNKRLLHSRQFTFLAIQLPQHVKNNLPAFPAQ